MTEPKQHIPTRVSSVLIALHVNGEPKELRIERRVSLLDALREIAGITGPKKGCNQGACGACTVLADGQRIISCMALAVQYDDREIITVEGLAEGSTLHELQQAFVKHDGLQCGYCTPGQICSAIGMVEEFKSGLPSAVSPNVRASRASFSDDEIRERMSGNLCRCGAYIGIREAIHQVFDAECSK